MRIVTVFKLLALLIVGLFLHYVLPQHDVVRVTSTEVIRVDFSGWNRIFYAQADSGNVEQPTRDLRLINTEKRKTWALGFVPRDSTEIMVYRNEDTGWIWPPYFKFDSSDLQAEASVAGRDDSWAVITHYGWRMRWASIYPNAIALREIDDPDNVTIVPWFNIAFFIFLAFCFGMLRIMWAQFRERSLDPLGDRVGDRYDAVSAGVAEHRSGVRNWLNSWRSKDKRR
ncbi:MAG: DUF1523 family protein [Loktanella sp.]|nr:DUF1523 family protein [Loktanella sp.]